MTNQNIIKTIKKVCEKEEYADFGIDSIYSVLAHSYYFVRPGKNFEAFHTELGKAMSNGAKKGAIRFAKKKWKGSIESCVGWQTSALILKVMRDFFDEKYFEEQITRMEDEEHNDENLLDKYLNLFDETHLKKFIGVVDWLSLNSNLFMDMDDSVDMHNTFNDLCREIDPSIPSNHGEDFNEIRRSFEMRMNNFWYMFDYLTKEKIVQIVREHITDHIILAGNVAKTLYCCGDQYMTVDCAILMNTCLSFYGVNVFNPELYEIEE